MSDKKPYGRFEDLLRYLGNQLSGKERYSIEKEMESDPFLMEAMEGFEQITANELEKEMSKLEQRLTRRTRRKRRITYYSAAAAIASLLIVSTLFVKLYDFNPEEASRKISDEYNQDKPVPELIEEDSEELPANEEDIEIESGLNELKEADIKESPGKTGDIPVPEKKITEERKGVVAEQFEEDKLAEDMTGKKMQESDRMPIRNTRQANQDITYMEAGQEAPESKQITASSPPANSKAAFRSNEVQLNPEDPSVKQQSISGIVISAEDSTPLPGASVIIKETSQGVVTSDDGTFNLTFAGDTAPTLVSTYSGMQRAEVRVKQDRNITLAMEPVISGRDDDSGDYPVQSKEPLAVESYVSEVDVSSLRIETSYTPPQPEGGLQSFKKYIIENSADPFGPDSPDRAVVILRFTVSSTGEIAGIDVLRTTGSTFSKEVKRLLNEGPSWNAAEKDGISIDDQVRLRIVFKK
jgi:hypothetical protein